jgi:hypothetical protein
MKKKTYVEVPDEKNGVPTNIDFGVNNNYVSSQQQSTDN